MLVDCFARRILAPFRGVLQLVRVGNGEALVARRAGPRSRAAWFERRPDAARYTEPFH